MKAAPVATRIAAQSWWDARQNIRNGEQLLLNLVMPALALVFAVNTPLVDDYLDSTTRRIDVVTPGILAMAALASGFTGQAIGTGFDRRQGVLRFIATTPLGRSGFLFGRIGSVILVQMLQIGTLSAIAFGLGWRPSPTGIPLALGLLVLAYIPFVGFGLWLAGTLRAEAVLALANLLWVLFIAAGVIFPVTQLPDAVSSWSRFLPATALAEGLRAACLTGQMRIESLLVLAVTGIIAVGGCAKFFKWQ